MVINIKYLNTIQGIYLVINIKYLDTIQGDILGYQYQVPTIQGDILGYQYQVYRGIYLVTLDEIMYPICLACRIGVARILKGAS